MPPSSIFFASIPHLRSTPLRVVSISVWNNDYRVLHYLLGGWLGEQFERQLSKNHHECPTIWEGSEFCHQNAIKTSVTSKKPKSCDLGYPESKMWNRTSKLMPDVKILRPMSNFDIRDASTLSMQPNSHLWEKDGDNSCWLCLIVLWSKIIYFLFFYYYKARINFATIRTLRTCPFDVISLV